MQYCQRCGSRLIGDKCHKCGKSYEKVKNLDIVKHTVNKEMRRHGIRLPTTPRLVIILAIVAIAVLLSYILFSRENTTETSTVLSRVQTQITQATNPQSSAQTPTQKTQTNTPERASLRTFHQMVNQIGGTTGCFGRVDGGVTNTGSVDAYDVRVTCIAEEVSSQTDLGIVKAGSTDGFQVILNYDCQHMRTEECTATCSNC